MISQVLWTLIAIQIALGAFDTIYHHELTERLPWRASQRHELQLHAVRNLIYAVLFVAIGWSEPHGYLAMLAIVVLAIEVVITLMDFVEEDLTRRLPARVWKPRAKTGCTVATMRGSGCASVGVGVR